ncbi:hypothetical protein JX265_011819 [Neoarthrinium moseri]|uniref:Uncharacterized protein n=1 Tax=Neoarthrinium moseri TaxID=1658444 RepID=A0A9P9WBS1_9PEZI|nr:hypothetical protein JX265_011819 [Neoarthrinium moseri]
MPAERHLSQQPTHWEETPTPLEAPLAVQMLQSFLFLSSVVRSGLSSASHDASRAKLGTWTLSNNDISCEDGTCSYSFNIEEEESGVTDACRFETHGSSRAPANQTNFESVRCGRDGQYAVNGGYVVDNTKTTGVVLVITNTVRASWAFFGYNWDEIADGPSKVSPSYPLGEFPATNGEFEDAVDHSRVCCLTLGSGSVSPLWNVRVVDEVGVHVDAMLLDHDDDDDMCCVINLAPPEGIDPRSWSLFHQKCRANNWSMSWGYQPVHDSAVMVFSDSDNAIQAWFAWNEVNSMIELYAPSSDDKETLCAC